MVQDDAGTHQPDARFIVSVARREEKGSDVNVVSPIYCWMFWPGTWTPPW